MTINYRLFIFGWLALSELVAEDVTFPTTGKFLLERFSTFFSTVWPLMGEERAESKQRDAHVTSNMSFLLFFCVCLLSPRS